MEKQVREFTLKRIAENNGLDDIVADALQLFGKFGGHISERIEHNEKVHRVVFETWLSKQKS